MEDLVMRIYRNESLLREWNEHVEDWMEQAKTGQIVDLRILMDCF